MKKNKVNKRMPKQESAPLPSDSQNILTMEKGILSLLSFLGHSFRRGSITEEFYKNQQQAAVQKLDQLIVEDSQDGATDFDSNLKRDKLLKNKGDVQSLLAFLEDSYNEGSVSEKSYRELKSENSKKLQRINNLLRQHGYSGDEAELEDDNRIRPPSQKYSNENDLGEFEDSGNLDASDSPSQEKEFLESSIPTFDSEPSVKPVYFSERDSEVSKSPDSKKKLDSFRKNLERMVSPQSASEEKLQDSIDEADDILRSLNINPKKSIQQNFPKEQTSDDSQKEPIADAYSKSASRDAAISKERMMGALSGLVSKFKKQAAGAPENKPSQIQAAGAAEPAPQAGGKPSWEDKLPEEMNPQELAEYNKVQENRAKEASGTAEVKEESTLSVPTSSDDGGGASAAEIAKIILEIEKMKVKVESTEGMRTVIEERIEHIMETIGELRTMLFEKEGQGKEQEAKLDRFIEMVSDLEPQKFAKELDKRDKQLSDQAFKIEKLENISSDMVESLGRIRSTLDAIGSLKNIATVSKDIADRSAKIDATVSKVERLADETGRVYVELNRKMNDFTLYRGKQDILAESLKELASMAESLGGKFDSYAQKDDLSNIKKDLEDVRLGITELSAKVELQSEGSQLPDHILDLQEEKEALEQILESNEEEFIEGKIKEDEYKKLKNTHMKKVETVRLKLREELSKIRKEGLAQQIKTKEINEGIKTIGKSDSLDDPSNEKAKPSGPLSDLAIAPSQSPRTSNPKANAAASNQKIPSQQLGKNQAPQEEDGDLDLAQEPQEIEGEMDDAKLEEAQDLSVSEDETLENEEEQGEDDANSEPLLPTKPSKGKIAKQSKPGKVEMGKSPYQKNSKMPPKPPQMGSTKPLARQSQKKSVVKTSVSSQLTKISSAKPLAEKVGGTVPSIPGMENSAGSRIFDIIKSQSVGKKVAFNANATTIKKNASQCLIKLEDSSGIIYGTYEKPLKGQMLFKGIIAKDASGISYVKIFGAK
ncbi:hypothetical protein HY989_06030 [Candidatus Micrarchaeota archaeon]|nr:hypothetical protein [Candidatus Micrarchaeota archaeon]